MRVKLKYALPLVQMALAVGLLRWSEAWFEAVMRVSDSPGLCPAFRLLIAISAPVGLPRLLWSRFLPGSWDYPILIAAVGLLWFWVALNVDSWRQGRAVCMFSRTPLRIAGDILLIVTGIFWGGVCVGRNLDVGAIVHGAYGQVLGDCYPRGWQDASLCIAVVVFQLTWSLVLIYFFGRDFIHCSRGKNLGTTLPI
jgi:hypothetical protein